MTGVGISATAELTKLTVTFATCWPCLAVTRDGIVMLCHYVEIENFSFFFLLRVCDRRVRKYHFFPNSSSSDRTQRCTMVKNKTPKASKSRPASTSELNQPLLPSAGATSATTASCSFSPAPDHSLFAHISNQVHQQRLRIYNASASASSASHLVTDFLLSSLGGASCLSSQWIRLSTRESKSAKRRKHDASEAEEASTSTQLLLALGLSSGEIHLLNPALAQSVAVLDASSSAGSSSSSAANTEIVSLTFVETTSTLFACSKSGYVSSFSLSDVKLGAEQSKSRPVFSFQPDSKAAVQLLSSQHELVLGAHHSIALTDTATADNMLRATFTGHASPVTHLDWVTPTSFVSAADGDRLITVWSYDVKDGSKTVSGRAVATAALDSPVRALSVVQASKQQSRALITVVTLSGSVRIYSLPSDSLVKTTSSPSRKKSAALPSLELLASGTSDGSSAAEWIDARLVDDKLRLARLIRGAKVSIDQVTILEPSTGEMKKSIALPKVGGKATSEVDGGILASAEAELTGGSAAAHRYTEAPSRPQGMDDAAAVNGLEEAGILPQSAEGVEPTLAQRLTALGFKDPSLAVDEDDELDVPVKRQSGALMNEASLATSLSQALHSGDMSLLTSCLNHNDPALIRNTVRKLSGPLSVKLLEECVGRLNGVGGSHVSKGTMGSQKARGLMEWVRATLLNHMGYLMSLPNLVTRLSGLHATLSSRLATHERLLALNGRLELVLSQIEVRAAYMAQASGNQLQVQGVKFGNRNQKAQPKKPVLDEKSRRQGKKWVEESDESSDDEMDIDGGDGVLVRGEEDEDGEVQDIALGGSDMDDDSDEDDDEDALPTRRKRVRNGRVSDGHTSADSDSDGDDDASESDEDVAVDDEEDDESDEDDESEIDGEGASDLEDDEDEEEYDEEDGATGKSNGLFDLEAEEGTDSEDED